MGKRRELRKIVAWCMAYLLQQLLEISARRTPDAVAVVCGDAAISYRRLDETADRLAHTLQMRGVCRGDRVGIYLSKSVESLEAIFGILKAGAVYVPLDPGAPVKRVAFIIGNCAMKALVTSRKKLEGLKSVLADRPSPDSVVLTDDGVTEEGGAWVDRVVTWAETMGAPGGWLQEAQPVIEDDLAYILYTSGSTGEPKGVMISHRAALTFVDWAASHFSITPSDRVSNHAPLHFDLSIFDIFSAIRAGAAVVLVPEELSVFPLDLADFIENERITIWYSVPSVLTALVLHGGLHRHRFASLAKILFAGEVFPIRYLRQLKAAIPHAQYYNLYGPTETNVCTVYPIQEIAPERVEAVPIGAACANTDVFAVNERNQIVRPGEVGELYVRGPSLMKGYWGLPEKTKQTLVLYPVGSSGLEEVVYRTGDLVKTDQDGNYVFLGRRDNMIKSRGYRIELGEIETVLYSHPDVEEVAVLAIPDERIGNVIKAIVVRKAGSRATKGEIESFCAERIPKYMIPGSIEFCTGLPKTSTGKIDRTLLMQHREGRSD